MSLLHSSSNKYDRNLLSLSLSLSANERGRTFGRSCAGKATSLKGREESLADREREIAVKLPLHSSTGQKATRSVLFHVQLLILEQLPILDLISLSLRVLSCILASLSLLYPPLSPWIVLHVTWPARTTPQTSSIETKGRSTLSSCRH